MASEIDNQVVYIVDDDADICEALALCLKSAGYMPRTYQSAMAFLEYLPQVRQGCVVTDIRMPRIDGLELQRRLQERKSGMPVIVMTAHGDISLAVSAMKAGAVDFLEKPIGEESLLAAIRTAFSRQSEDMERGNRAAEVNRRFDLLSERERQVLDGIVAGKSNKTIARDLGLSARTVEAYRANVMTKMQADSLSSLVRMALAHNSS